MYQPCASCSSSLWLQYLLRSANWHLTSTRTMQNIQDMVSSLEHALPTPELVSDWYHQAAREPFETVKTLLFFYVLAVQLIAVFRHLRARGLRQSLVDGYTWTSKVSLFLVFSHHPIHATTESIAARPKTSPGAKETTRGTRKSQGRNRRQIYSKGW